MHHSELFLIFYHLVRVYHSYSGFLHDAYLCLHMSVSVAILLVRVFYARQNHIMVLAAYLSNKVDFLEHELCSVNLFDHFHLQIHRYQIVFQSSF